MLTVMPEDRVEMLKKYKCEKNGAVLVARDKVTELGYIVISDEKETVYIHEIYIDGAVDLSILNFDQKYMGELLIRAAGNFALNRKKLSLESNDMNVFFIAEQLGFMQNSEKAVIELSKLFKKCEKHEK